MTNSFGSQIYSFLRFTRPQKTPRNRCFATSKNDLGPTLLKPAQTLYWVNYFLSEGRRNCVYYFLLVLWAWQVCPECLLFRLLLLLTLIRVTHFAFSALHHQYRNYRTTITLLGRIFSPSRKNHRFPRALVGSRTLSSLDSQTRVLASLLLVIIPLLVAPERLVNA